MSAYEDAIGRARGLLDGSSFTENGTHRGEYKRALVELCATFDPDRPMDEAIDEATRRIEYRSARTLVIRVNVPDLNTTDEQVKGDITQRLETAALFTLYGVEVRP